MYIYIYIYIYIYCVSVCVAISWNYFENASLCILKLISIFKLINKVKANYQELSEYLQFVDTLS
jgi:hypothetical protein